MYSCKNQFPKKRFLHGLVCAGGYACMWYTQIYKELASMLCTFSSSRNISYFLKMVFDKHGVFFG